VSQPKAAVPEPTEIAGRYQIVQKLGAGAFGTVYKAKDKLLGRMLAIKTIRLEGLAAAGTSMDELVDRFRREAQVSAQLKHPNIVTIYDIGESDGVTYLAMEFIDGVGLDKIISQAGYLPVERAASLGQQIADALDFAHKGGVVHRDIKPANIMVEAGDRVKVTDFGIAKVMDSGDHLTMTGSLLGTPSYMSPEQARGSALDGRSDLFAVGAIIYEMLAGKKAFRGDSITGLIFKIITEEPPDIRAIQTDVPDGMVSIIAKALAKAPEARYQSGRELAEDLQQFTRAGATPTLRQTETPTASGLNPTVMGPPPTVLGAAPTSLAKPSPPPPTPAPPAPSRPPAGRAAVPPVPRPAAPPPRQSSSKAGLLIGLAAAGFFFLLVAGGVGWYFLRKPTPPVASPGAGLGSTADVRPGTTTPAVTQPPGTSPTEAPYSTIPAGTLPGTVTPPVTSPTNTGRPPTSVPPGTMTAGRDPGPTGPAVTAPPDTRPARGDYAFLDEEQAPIDGREAGERVAGTYRSDRGSTGSGGFGATGRLRARERSPRDLTPAERPAVATLRQILNYQEVYQKRQRRYGSLAELMSAVGLRLDVPPAGNTFERRGYRFELTANGDGFSVLAMPVAANGRPFFGDDSGFIRVGTE
jgi:eukaryotic-like serine/threonine-protein kinase